MVALDADKDGQISAKEIEGAVKALKKLDKNEDGRLTQDELRPPRGGPGGFGPMGPGEQGRGRGPNEQGRGRGGPGEPGQMGGFGRGGPGGGDMAQRIMGFDQDKDGRVTKDEVPEQMRERMFGRADANGDGAIDKEEAEKMAERMGRGGPGGQGGPGGRGGGDFVQRLMGLDRDDDGKVAKDEAPQWMQERMFDRADANGDGFIDKQEAEKMGEQFQRGGPPRGPGRGQGGPGGRPPGDTRPERPEEE